MDFSFLLAREMKRPGLEGALMTSMRAGGPAEEAKPAILARNGIVEVNGEPVKSVEALEALTRKLTQSHNGPVPAMVAFERKAERYLTVARVGAQDLRDPGLEVTKAWLPIETRAVSREIARQLERPD